MKKNIVAAFFALSLAVSGQAVIPSSVCHAEVHYADGDANYPIWGVTMAALTIYRHASSIMRTMTT